MDPRLSINVLKGVAILMIMGVHARRGWFGWQGVHVFLMLSGYLLARSAASTPLPAHAWLRRRALRILPSYWVTALAGAGMVALLPDSMRLARNGAILSAPSVLMRDMLLLRNLDYTTMFGPVNASLWYVPLLLGLYLCFPVLHGLYQRTEQVRGLAVIALSCVAVELLTRAAAIFWLDGIPVGAGHGFLRAFGDVSEPLDRWPVSTPFQLWAPFGAFPTRIGEFSVGVLAGVLWSRDPARYAMSLVRTRTLAVSAVLWLTGGLLSHYRAGWIASDLLIAVGLTPLLLGVAMRSQTAIPRVMQRLAWLGEWSYYIFLTHVLVATSAGVLAMRWQVAPLVAAGPLIGLVILGMIVSCRVLRAVDDRVARAFA